MSTATEVKSPDHPARLVARRWKDALTGFFREGAERWAAFEDFVRLHGDSTVRLYPPLKP